jgi:hypothetical protein
MDHLVTPLETLRAHVLAWLPKEGSRLLRVNVDAELYEGARALVAAVEWAPDNRRPFFEVKGAGAWDERATGLRAAYDARVAAFLEQGIALPPLPAPPPGAGPAAAFAACLARLARVFDDPALGTRGVIVVATRAGDQVIELVGAPGLERVRWICLDAGAGTGVGSDAAFACRIDRAAQKREIDELLAAMIAGIEAGACGAPGAARPRMAPPPHPSDAPAVDRAGGAAAPQVRPLLAAIQAARAAGPAAALPPLRRARDAAAEAGLGVEAAEMELLLGAFAVSAALAQGGSMRQVAPVFESAAARAEAAGAPATAAKARFFLGAAAASSGELPIAGQALVAAAEQARRAGGGVLAFHALRLAGDLATGAGLRARGVELWSEAVQIADGMEATEARAAGLAPVAEALRRAVGRAGTHAFELREIRWSPPGAAAPGPRAARFPR